MQIAHVLASYEVGGGESVALALAACQRAQGHEVHAVAFAVPDGPMAERFRAASVKTHLIPKRPGVDWTLAPRLLAFFLRQRVDVVHTHNPQGLVYAAPAARLAGVRLVHTKHGDAIEPRRRMWLRGVACRLADAVVSVSGHTAAQARQVGESTALHVVENGVDTSLFRPDERARAALRAELGLPAGARLVGTAGRLAAIKNQALLLRAAAPLLAPDVHLVIVGDGPLRETLEELARELGRTNEVRFLGMRTDVPRILTALDVFALSSHSEGLPLVLLEAMSTAVPVVSTAVGGIPEVVEDGGSGLLVQAGDEAGLRRAIARLLGDAALRSRLGERGRALVVARHSLERMAARYQVLYGAAGTVAS